MRWAHAFGIASGDDALTMAISKCKTSTLTNADVAHLRALVIGTLHYCRIATSEPPTGIYGVVEYGELVGAKYKNEADRAIGSLLAGTLCLIGSTTPQNIDIGTNVDSPVGPLVIQPKMDPLPPPTEGPPAIILVVGICAAAVAAISLIASGAAVIDRELSRREETKTLLAKQAIAVDTVREHARREDATGQTIPWSQGELEIMKGVQVAQEDTAKKQNKKWQLPFEGAFDWSTMFGGGGDGGSGSGSIWPWIIGAGALFIAGRASK